MRPTATPSRTRHLACTLALVLGMAAMPALAGTPTPHPLPILAPLAAPAPPTMGLMAFLDPETGLLTGPVGTLPTLDVLSMPAPNLQAVTLPDGSLMVDLQGTGMEYSYIQIDPLGLRSISCTSNPRALQRTLASPFSLPIPRPMPAPLPPQPEER